MAVMDEFKEEREALKHGTLKQKISYYWMYFKWYVLLGAAILAIAISMIYGYVTRKPDALSAAFINCMPAPGEEAYLADFAEGAGINTEKNLISVDSALYITRGASDQTSVFSSQKIMVFIAAQDIDILVGDMDTYLTYAYEGVLTDVRNILSADLIERYEPYFFYVDQSIIDESMTGDELVSLTDVPNYPDPTLPSAMKNPIPVAIFVNESVPLQSAYEFPDGPTVIGVVINTKRQDTAVAFMEYVIKDLPQK
jgi:hypothetical protein